MHAGSAIIDRQNTFNSDVKDFLLGERHDFILCKPSELTEEGHVSDCYINDINR
jgi:hypothetical protein